MPAVSEKQKALFCIAMSIKKGDTPASFSKQAAKIAEDNSLETIEDFCKD